MDCLISNMDCLLVDAVDAVPATEGFLKAFFAEVEFVESEFAVELFDP